MRPTTSILFPAEAGKRWSTSSYSGQANNCLEHGVLSGARQAVRDTKDPDRRTTLTFPASSWQPFLEAIAREML
ncbi:DUF397 domain-containing protein [Streptomyces mobaraensis]|uniref:DUF397 domain-containing protein n=1 Tax=Streptomyces mobaraensis TaxID=35621 RepID=A0A5N5WBZ8_STRMB|nr:DUF397 domain-containing protein [Streptomyces mobaraensis]KAB7849272.1 DUF397 domain-containing protein [Streptomyces mobaraensis]